MRTFTMERLSDETGVSGTGIVIEGVEFTNGKVVVRWTGEIGSVVHHDSLENFCKIHMYPHPTNRSILEFSDGHRIWQGEDGSIQES